jgi:hypothetical protein
MKAATPKLIDCISELDAVVVKLREVACSDEGALVESQARAVLKARLTETAKKGPAWAKGAKALMSEYGVEKVADMKSHQVIECLDALLGVWIDECSHHAG